MSEVILRAIARAMARVRRVMLTRMLNLSQLIDGREVPDAFAAELASVVGFSSDLRLSSRITDPAEWRRIIQLAPDIWSRKGGHDVLRDVDRAFAAAPTWIGDWFSLRMVAGDTEFPWIGTQSVHLNGQYWTEVHVEDASDTLDQDLIADALNLVRAIGERFNITFVRMVENWDNLFRWTVTGAGNVAGNVLSVDASAAAVVVETDADLDTTLWTDVTYNALVYVDTAATLKFRFREEGVQHYEVQVPQGPGVTIDLLRDGVSVATAVGEVPPPPEPAIGIINTVAGAALVDGETFTLSDGETVVVFEFDDNGAVSGSNVAVTFAGGDTAGDVRDTIIAAIAAQTLDITPSIGGAAAVALVHNANTSMGNVLITDTVAAAGFSSIGMFRGVSERGQLLSVRTGALINGDLQIDVVLNGDKLITYVDTTPRATGSASWRAASGSHTVLWFEVLPANPDTRTIE